METYTIYIHFAYPLATFSTIQWVLFLLRIAFETFHQRNRGLCIEINFFLRMRLEFFRILISEFGFVKRALDCPSLAFYAICAYFFFIFNTDVLTHTLMKYLEQKTNLNLYHINVEVTCKPTT